MPCLSKPKTSYPAVEFFQIKIAFRRNVYVYEHHSHPLLSQGRFIRRLLMHGFVAGAIIVVSLGAGILG